MELSVVFLQYLLVILLAKYATSSEDCKCQLPGDFCKPDITAVQGKVLGSQLVSATGDLVSDTSLAQKTRYRVKLTHSMINGSHELLLVNNTFKIPVPLEDPCNFIFTKWKSYVFVGNVNSNGRWSKLNCNLPIESSGQGNGSRGGFQLGDGDDTNFNDLCTNR